VRIWHANTYRLESTLNYGLERAWSISCLKGSNNVAIGYDEGSIMIKVRMDHTHTHTHTFNGPFSGTTQVSRFQKGKTNLDFTGARDSEWQWHQLGHMQICTSLQTDNHASPSPLSFLQAGCPSCRPTNSVKALKAYMDHTHTHTHTRLTALCPGLPG